MRPTGQVLKPNGVDGELLVSFRGIDPDDINLQEPVFIEFDGLPVPYFFESLVRRSSSRASVRLTGVRTLRDASELEGKTIFSESEPEAEDQVDITGWTVLDSDGRVAGTVDDIEDIPGNTCLSIIPQGKAEPVLIPFHEDLVLEVNEKEQSIRMVIPEGLL